MSTTDHVNKKRRVEVAAVEEPPKHFCCAVCMHAPDCNVFQCRNGHILCDGCLQKLRDGRRNDMRAECPTCHEHGDFFRNLAVENVIADMPAVCQYCAEGTTRGTLASHVLRCPSAPDVTCSRHLEGCEWTGKGSERAEHETKCAIVRLCAQHDAAHAHDLSNDSTRRRRLYLAADAGHESVVGMFLRSDSRLSVEEGGRMLYNAAHRNQEALVTMLLHHKPDVNKAMKNGVTPLLVAAHNGHEVVMRALVEAGADVNKTMDRGITPLHIAAYRGQEVVVRALIEAGADPDKAMNDGMTARRIAERKGLATVLAIIEKASNIL